MAVGNEPDLEVLKPIRNLGCAQRYIIPSTEGVVTEISGCDDAIKLPGVVMSEFFPPKIGSTIGSVKSHADRFGQIICTAETRDVAIECCESAISKINIRIK